MLFKFTKIIFTAVFLLSINNIQSQVFWNEVNSGVTVSLRSVSNVNANIAWVCGASGTVIKSTNGGYNWTNHTGNGIPSNVLLINIFAVDANLALTAGYIGTNTFVYRTSNSGANWSQVFTQANGFINAVWMRNTTNGFMQGDPVGGRWSLWKTSNGGVSWDSTSMRLPQTGTEAGWNNSLFADSNKIWFGTNNNRIYYSSNFGSSWSVQSTSPALNSYTIGFEQPNEQIGIAGSSVLIKTTNGGNNWDTLSTPGTGNFTGAVITQNYIRGAWYVRGSNTIYSAYYPYTYWFSQYTAPSGSYNHIAVGREYGWGPGMMFAVRSNGGISRANIFIEGVKILSNLTPSMFKLYQNYPNPFNPATKIKLEIPLLKNNAAGEVMGSLIRIKIYNSLGQEIETVLNQITQPGIYEAEWNGANYPSGIYYYVVTVNDPRYPNAQSEQRETKKMVLVK